MSKDYVKVVLAAYEKKKISGELSPNMLNPTPGNIREECLAIYGKDDKTKDDEVLRLFFSQPVGKSGYFDTLENSRAEKFKQVPKVLNGQVPKPGLKYVELLAWLIDFPIRPITTYNLSLKDKSMKEVKVDKRPPGEIEREEIDNRKDVTSNHDKKEGVPELIEGINKYAEKSNENIKDKFFLFKKWSIGIVATIILVGFFFPRYMTWKGDRYEWLIFNTKKESVIAINWDLLINFRKVKNDTLTEYSIGKLYYLKENNDHDVFTMAGKHPVLVTRNLRPLSKTILDSIIKHNMKPQKQIQSLIK